MNKRLRFNLYVQIAKKKTNRVVTNMKIPAMTLTDPSSGSPVDSDDDEEGADEDSISVELFSFSNIIFFSCVSVWVC